MMQVVHRLKFIGVTSVRKESLDDSVLIYQKISPDVMTQVFYATVAGKNFIVWCCQLMF